MKHKIIVFLSSIIVATLIGGIFWSTLPTFYEGKETFYTKTEYQDFKIALDNPSVSIDEMIVLSSDPPIVIQYTIAIPHGESFPYGEINKSWKYGTPIFLFIVFGAVSFIVFHYYLIQIHKEES